MVVDVAKGVSSLGATTVVESFEAFIGVKVEEDSVTVDIDVLSNEAFIDGSVECKCIVVTSSADELVSLSVDILYVVNVDALVSSKGIPIDVPSTVVFNTVLVVEISSAVAPADVDSDKLLLVSSVFSSNFVDIADASVVTLWFKVDMSCVDCVDDTDIVDDNDVFSIESWVIVSDGEGAVVVDKVFKTFVVKFSFKVVSVEKSAVEDDNSVVEIVDVCSLYKTEVSGSSVTISVVDPSKLVVIESCNSVLLTNFTVVSSVESFPEVCSVSIVMLLRILGLFVEECDVISPVYNVEGSLCGYSVTVINVSLNVEDISSVNACALDAVVCVGSTSGIEVVVGEFEDKEIVSTSIAVGCSVEVDISLWIIFVILVVADSVVGNIDSLAADSVVKGVVVDCLKNVVADFSDVEVCSANPLV